MTKFPDKYLIIPGTLAALLCLLFSIFASGQNVFPRPEPIPTRVDFSYAVGPQGAGSNQTQITITLRDRNLNPIPFHYFDLYFSDNTSCNGVTSTNSSGTSGMIETAQAGSNGYLVGVQLVTSGTAGGIVNMNTAATSVNVISGQTNVTVQNNAGYMFGFNRVMTGNLGTVVWGIIASAKTGWTPCVWIPELGRKAGGAALVAANFGTIIFPLDGILEDIREWAYDVVRRIFQADAGFLNKWKSPKHLGERRSQ